jgi:hypothetical protein
MTGLLLSRSRPAIRIEFSTDRAGKRIRWEQSTRLLQGTMVALSPASDNFASICRVAVVAARPFTGGLDQNPPTIDIFLENMEDLQLDPTKGKTALASSNQTANIFQNGSWLRLVKVSSRHPDMCCSVCRRPEQKGKRYAWLYRACLT